MLSTLPGGARVAVGTVGIGAGDEPGIDPIHGGTIVSCCVEPESGSGADKAHDNRETNTSILIMRDGIAPLEW